MSVMEVDAVVPVAAENKSETPAEFDEKACAELFALGKRNLLCGDVPQSVNQLQEVCRQLAAKFGETAPECAESYFYYGSALLELGRMESRVLGNALQGMTEDEADEPEAGKEDAEDGFAVPSTITDEEKEKISEEVLDAMLEKDPAVPAPAAASDEKPPTASSEQAVGEKGDVAMGEATEPTPDKPTESGDAGTKEPPKPEGEQETPKPEGQTEGEGDEKGDEGEDGEDDEGEEEEGEETEEAAVAGGEPDKDVSQDEDVSNLQLAWEMLELAKNIYCKQETKEAKMKQGECLKKLGEVGVESENYTQSIEDFATCIQLFTDNVGDVKTDRRLAEAHYHAGVACVYAGRYDDGSKHFHDAIEILEAKTELLRANVAKETEAEALAAAQSELKEITDLIPDIKLKIEDCEEEKNAVHLKDAINEAGDGVSTTGFGAETSSASPATVCEAKPVDDVTHLVRKKRKPEDDDTANETKKPKTCESTTEIPAVAVVTNGNSNGISDGAEKTNGTNGTAESMDVVVEQTEIKVKSVADCTPVADEPTAEVAAE